MTNHGTMMVTTKHGNNTNHQQNTPRMMQRMNLKITTVVMARVAMPWVLAAQSAAANGMPPQHVL